MLNNEPQLGRYEKKFPKAHLEFAELVDAAMEMIDYGECLAELPTGKTLRYGLRIPLLDDLTVLDVYYSIVQAKNSVASTLVRHERFRGWPRNSIKWYYRGCALSESDIYITIHVADDPVESVRNDNEDARSEDYYNTEPSGILNNHFSWH